VAVLLRARCQLRSGGIGEWHEVVASRGRLWQRLLRTMSVDSQSDRVRRRALKHLVRNFNRVLAQGRIFQWATVVLFGLCSTVTLDNGRPAQQCREAKVLYQRTDCPFALFLQAKLRKLTGGSRSLDDYPIPGAKPNECLCIRRPFEEVPYRSAAYQDC